MKFTTLLQLRKAHELDDLFGESESCPACPDLTFQIKPETDPLCDPIDLEESHYSTKDHENNTQTHSLPQRFNPHPDTDRQESQLQWADEEESSHKQSSQGSGSNYSAYGEKSKKTKKISKSQKDHPLKNFLQDFKSPILKYLRNKIGNDAYFFSLTVVQDMSKPNKDNYQNLFNFEELRPYLAEMFSQKMLYRHCMVKISPKNKVAYIKHLHVFERAFITRVFESIM